MGDEITFGTIVLKLIEKTQKNILVWNRIDIDGYCVYVDNDMTGVSIEEDARVFDRYGIYIGRSERLLTAVVEQVRYGRK